MTDLLNPIGRNNEHAKAVNPNLVKENTKEEFEEGTEDIVLPSRGVFYYPPFNNIKELHVRPLGWKDEDLLTTKKFIDDGTIFDKLVNEVLQDKGISAYDLVPVDRDMILLWLRSTSMGNIMEVSYECPACKHKNKAVWDLSTLKLPEYPSEEIYQELSEKGEIRIETPRGLIVYIKVPTIRESKDTEKRLLKKKEDKKSETDFLATGTLQLIISGIELEPGKIERNKNKIFNHFDEINLGIADTRYIRKKAKEITLAFDTKQNLTCANKECGYVQEDVELPIIHPNFLWADE